MYRKINYSDHLEKQIGEILQECSFVFTHESEVSEKQLDFKLKTSGVQIEIKQYHSDRIAKQLNQHENVIVLQGKKSVKFFCDLLRKNKQNFSKVEISI